MTKFNRIRSRWLPIIVFGLFWLVPSTLAAEGEGQSTVSSFVPLMFALGIIILASRVGGSIARLAKQPRVLGQLIIGVLMGPTLLDLLHWQLLGGVDLSHTIKEMAELGVLLLMFNIGLEVHLNELVKVGKVALFAGFLGVVLPVILGGLVVLSIGLSWQVALFAGVTLAATSVSISAQVLLELNYLRSKVGNALLATALIDDVLAILLVSLTIAIVGSDGGAVDLAGMGTIILQMGAYIVIASLITWFVVPRIFNSLAKRPEAAQAYGMPILAIVLALLFGWSAEYFGGVAAITGAFIAGVGLSKLSHRRTRQDIQDAVSYTAYVFFVPIFFINVGLETDLSTFPLTALPFMLSLLAVAIISKILGSWIGGRMGGFDNNESLQLGMCMVSRGEVGLIIASLGLSSGIFDPRSELFAALFMVILLTTVMTPPLVRWIIHKRPVTEETGELIEAGA